MTAYFTSRRFQLLFYQQVRHGGSRPGGAPTFNWKEKRILNISNKPKLNLRKAEALAEDFDEIKKLLTENGEGKFIDLTNMTDFEEEEIDEASQRKLDKKTIQVSMLFGPHKLRGSIPRKDDYDRRTKIDRYLKK